MCAQLGRHCLVRNLPALIQCFAIGLAIGYGAFSLANILVPGREEDSHLQGAVGVRKDTPAVATPPRHHGIGRAAAGYHNSQDGCPERPLNLLVLLPSAPSGVNKRHVIRSTWLQEDAHTLEEVKVTGRFVIGTNQISAQTHTDLLAENGVFKDLLFIPDVRDSYQNLTAKVLQSLVLAYEHYEFDYVLKADEDSYIRIRKIAKSLRVLGCNQLLYWGHFTGRSAPTASGRWAEHEWNLCAHYIPYALGGGYLLSRKLVGNIARVWRRLKLYGNEDISIATWLAPFKVNKKHDTRFDVDSVSFGCHNNLVITHKVGLKGMLQYHRSLTSRGRLCPAETLTTPLHTYNWTLPPSKCCYPGDSIPEETDTAYF